MEVGSDIGEQGTGGRGPGRGQEWRKVGFMTKSQKERGKPCGRRRGGIDRKNELRKESAPVGLPVVGVAGQPLLDGANCTFALPIGLLVASGSQVVGEVEGGA